MPRVHGFSAFVRASRETAIENKPDLAAAHQNLGLALAMSGKLAEALPELEQAVTLSGGRDAVTLDLLGRVYAGLGRFADAFEAARRALDIAVQRNQPDLARDIKARVAQYQARIPLRGR